MIFDIQHFSGRCCDAPLSLARALMPSCVVVFTLHHSLLLSRARLVARGLSWLFFISFSRIDQGTIWFRFALASCLLLVGGPRNGQTMQVCLLGAC